MPDFSNPNWSLLPKGPGTKTWSDGAWRGTPTPEEQAAWDHSQATQARQQRNVKLIKAGTAITGGLIGAGALSALFAPAAGAGAGGGSGAASGAAGWAMPGVTAPTMGGAATTGATSGLMHSAATPSIWSKLAGLTDLFSLGTNAGLSIYGSKQQQKGVNQARQDTLEAQRQAISLQLQQLEEQKRSSDLDREDLRKLNEAQNALKKQELDILQEQNAYTRSQSDYERSLVEQREARLAPTRALSAKAQQRLAAMWGL